MLTTIAEERLSFDLTALGIEAVNNGELKVGDLIRRDIGDGTRLWKIVAIEDGKCYVQEPTILGRGVRRRRGLVRRVGPEVPTQTKKKDVLTTPTACSCSAGALRNAQSIRGNPRLPSVEPKHATPRP